MRGIFHQFKWLSFNLLNFDLCWDFTSDFPKREVDWKRWMIKLWGIHAHPNKKHTTIATPLQKRKSSASLNFVQIMSLFYNVELQSHKWCIYYDKIKSATNQIQSIFSFSIIIISDFSPTLKVENWFLPFLISRCEDK